MEHVECFVYRLASGQSVERLKEAIELSQTLIAKQPGYRERKLVQLEEGRFLEFNRWASKEDFHRANAAVLESEAAAPLMKVLDMDSLTPYHGDLVLNYEG
jgi:hypothetical protein